MSSREAQLADLLRSLFPLSGDLHRFLGRLDDGRDVLDSLPGPNTPVAELAHLVVVALDARGTVDEAFFTALVGQRPKKRDDVVKVATEWGVDALVPPGSSSASRLPAMDPMTDLVLRLCKVEVDISGVIHLFSRGLSSEVRVQFAQVLYGTWYKEFPIAVVFVQCREILVHGVSDEPGASEVEKWFYHKVIPTLVIFGLVEAAPAPSGVRWPRYHLSAKGRDLAEWTMTTDWMKRIQEAQMQEAIAEIGH